MSFNVWPSSYGSQGEALHQLTPNVFKLLHKQLMLISRLIVV